MLGKTELVKPVLEEYPNLISAKGPHGFSLLHHAKKVEKRLLSCMNIYPGRDWKQPNLRFDEEQLFLSSKKINSKIFHLYKNRPAACEPVIKN